MFPEVGSTIVPPGSSFPSRLGGLDHAQPDPVLVRPAGRHVLELREQRAAELGPDIQQADDGRPADEIEQRRVLARHGREA